MYAFHERLFNRGKGYTPTPDDIAIARGDKPLSTAKLDDVPNPVNTIQNAFARQVESKVVSWVFVRAITINHALLKEPWNQSVFEQKMTTWIAASDTPFSEVESPHFKSLLKYVRGNSDLFIPSAQTIQRRVMKMGDTSVEDLKQTIQVH